MDQLKKSLVGVFTRLHWKVFHHEPSQEMLGFVDNIGIFFLASLISGPLLFLVSVLSGRILGPSEFGTYSLVLSASTFIGLLMSFGFNASAIRYISKAKVKGIQEEIGKLIFSALVLNYLYVLIIAVPLLIWAEPIRSIINLSSQLYYLCLFIAFLSANWSVVRSIILAVNMAKEVWFEVTMATLYLLGLLIFLQFSHSATSPLFGYIIAYVSVIIGGCWSLRKQIVWSLIDQKSLLRFLAYGLLSGLLAISDFFFTGVDRMVLGIYLPVTLVGIYSAYYAASVFLTATGWQILSSVLAPTVNRFEDKRAILRKINRGIIVLFIPAFVLNVIVLGLIYSLFGGAYDFDIFRALIFALNALLFMIVQIYNLILAAEGIRGVRYSAAVSLSAAVILLIGMIGVAPLGGIVWVLFVRTGVLLGLLFVLISRCRSIISKSSVLSNG